MSEPSAVKSLTVVGGPNGSGKTTFAEAYFAQQPQPFLSADSIAAELRPENPTAARIAAGREFLRRVERQLGGEDSFLLESTLSGKTLLRSLERARHRGFEIHVIFIHLDAVETCIHRVHERTRKGGHDVPDEDIRRRYQRSLVNFWRVYRQIAESWAVIYNSAGGFEDVAVGDTTGLSVRNAVHFRRFLKTIDEPNDA